MAGGKEILFKRRSHYINGCLFCVIESILSGFNQQIREALNDVYKPERRLCWKM